MRDAAYAVDIGPYARAVAGYYGGPEAFHVWSAEDWRRYAGNPEAAHLGRWPRRGG